MTARLVVFCCYVSTCCSAPPSLVEQVAHCLGRIATIPTTREGQPDIPQLASSIHQISQRNEQARMVIADEIRKRFGPVLVQTSQQWLIDDCIAKNHLVSHWYRDEDVPAFSIRQDVYSHPNQMTDRLWFLLMRGECDPTLCDDANKNDQTMRALKLIASYRAYDHRHRIRMFACNDHATVDTIGAFIQEEYEDEAPPIVCVTHQASSPLVDELATTYSVDLYLHLGNGYDQEHGRSVPVLHIPYKEEPARSWWARARPALLVGGIEKTANC